MMRPVRDRKQRVIEDLGFIEPSTKKKRTKRTKSETPLFPEEEAEEEEKEADEEEEEEEEKEADEEEEEKEEVEEGPPAPLSATALDVAKAFGPVEKTTIGVTWAKERYGLIEADLTSLPFQSKKNTLYGGNPFRMYSISDIQEVSMKKFTTLEGLIAYRDMTSVEKRAFTTARKRAAGVLRKKPVRKPKAVPALFVPSPPPSSPSSHFS